MSKLTLAELRNPPKIMTVDVMRRLGESVEAIAAEEMTRLTGLMSLPEIKAAIGNDDEKLWKLAVYAAVLGVIDSSVVAIQLADMLDASEANRPDPMTILDS
jgi:hypothetical protein